MPAMSDELDRYAAERRLGAALAEAFDRRLREVEEGERRERLHGLDAAAAPEAQDGGEALPAGRPSLVALQLESENKRLRDYYLAVQGSRAWRLTQQLRRLVGRAW
jgi:hypothetical protein